MIKEDKNYIIDLLNDIIDRLDYYSFLDDNEKQVHDILEDASRKIEAIKL